MKYFNFLISFLLLSCSTIDNNSSEHKPKIENQTFSRLDVGTQMINHDDNSISFENGVMYSNQTAYTGWVYRYSEDSILISKTGYFEGLMEDTLYKYYPSGKIEHKRPYHKGKKHGVHMGWYESGKINFRYEFNFGLSIGEQKKWHETGELAVTRNYKNGKMLGLQQGRLKNGKIRFNYYITEEGKRYGLMGANGCVSVKPRDKNQLK